MIGPHQMIGRGLGGGVGGIGGVLVGLAEGWIVGPQRAVNLIGRDMMKAVGAWGLAIEPDRLGRLEQDMGADDVGVDKLIRAMDRAIDMGFSGKMYQGINTFFP